MATHELKTWPEYFQQIKSRANTFELRKNDRNFQVGDTLILKEFEPSGYNEVSPNEIVGQYTGGELKVKVDYIFAGHHDGTLAGLSPSYCIMSISHESTTSLMQEDVKEAAMKYAQTGWKQVDDDTPVIDEVKYNAFLAGAAHGQQGSKKYDDTDLAVFTKLVEQFINDETSYDSLDQVFSEFTKGQLTYEEILQSQPLPSNIAEALEQANPYKDPSFTNNEFHIWDECVSKLRELLSSQPEEKGDSKTKIKAEGIKQALNFVRNIFPLAARQDQLKHAIGELEMFYANYGTDDSAYEQVQEIIP